MVSLMYYVGAMQKVIKAIAVVLQFVLKTTPIESFATATHIFVGQVSCYSSWTNMYSMSLLMSTETQ